MAMDMGAMMKMMAAKNQFEKNHPKFFSFCKAAFGRGVEVDTIFEITVTKPNGETLTTNLKVCQSDLDLQNRTMGCRRRFLMGKCYG